MTDINERSTAIATIPFVDHNGDPMTPTSATWTLSDAAEPPNIINSRSNVTITPLSTSVTIVLSGDDLALSNSYFGTKRILTVKAVYDSDLGDDLPFNAETTFEITPLVNVS